MIVECVRRFRDVETREMHEIGDRFEVSPERFAAINGTRYGTLACEVLTATQSPETLNDDVVEGTRRRRSKKRSEEPEE